MKDAQPNSSSGQPLRLSALNIRYRLLARNLTSSPKALVLYPLFDIMSCVVITWFFGLNLIWEKDWVIMLPGYNHAISW